MNGIWRVDNAGFGNVVFLNRDPREAGRQKKQFESSLPLTFLVGSISAVSRVRSLILPEERLSGDECWLIFPNSGW